MNVISNNKLSFIATALCVAMATVIAPMLEIGIIGALLARRWRRVIRGPVDAGDSSPPATGNATEQT